MNISAQILTDEAYSLLLRKTLSRLGAGFENDKSTMILPAAEGLWERRPGFFFHFHYELFFQLDGACLFCFPRHRLTLKPGEILLVPPGLPHYEAVLSWQGVPFRNLVIMIAEKQAWIHLAECRGHAERADKPDPVYRETFGNSSRIALYYALVQAAHHAGEDVTAAGRSFRLDLIWSLCRAILYDLGPRGRQVVLPEVWEHMHYKIRKVREIIEQSGLAHIPGVAELAARIGCTPNYLSWLFRRETGQNLKDYVNRYRMEYARQLLETMPSSGIAEIAWSCGFQDAAYFARLFQRYCGCKPSEYRRQH